MIRHELGSYSQTLAEKPELVVASKLDLSDQSDPPELTAFREALGVEVMPISSVSGVGLDALTNRLWGMLEEA